jgi:hypothetical protein
MFLSFRQDIARLANAAVRRLFLLFFKTLGMKKGRFHRCLFYGDPAFLEMCEEAMDMLEMRDALAYKAISESDYIFFFHKNVIMSNRFSKTFSITQEFCDWSADGIASRVIYCHYLSLLIGQKTCTKAEFEDGLNLVDSATSKWLKDNGYPELLWEYFTAAPQVK